LLFNSLEYLLLFLPITLIIYFWLNKRELSSIAKGWLVIASFVFYCRQVPLFGFLLLGSILFNYTMGQMINRRKQGAGVWLFCAIAADLAVLGYFKYTNFFIDNLVAISHWNISVAKIVLPLGISFFTFTQIAYLVDVYRRIAHEYSLLHYFLFVTYFPHLVAGPILHHKEMMPQFADSKNNTINWENIFTGLFIFSIGLFKKVVVADQFALWVNAGFTSTHPLLFHEAWITSLSYTLQIYFDFSGYTDMAIGASLMLNIKLPLNFNSPYKAVNIQDFWRRWHMTLSRWLRDYVYIPLGGSRKGSMHTYLNLVITFLLGGLWHGANWTFVMWGAMHGAASAIHKGWEARGFKMPTWLGWLITFLFINASWVFFRANTFAEAMSVLRGMAGINGFALSAAYSNDWHGLATWAEDTFINNKATLLFAFPWLLVWLPIAFFAPNSMEASSRFANKGLVSAIGIGLVMAIPLFVMVFMSTRITQFIYFNF